MKQHKLHRISYIAKRFIIIFVLTCVLVSPKEIEQADAQIFIMTEEEFLNNERNRITDGSLVPILPQGGQEDWIFAPLDGGWLLLAGLGGAYLLGKRRKKR